MKEHESPVIVRNLLEVFNEKDETKRLQVLQELYVPEAVFFEDDASFKGHEAINLRVTEVLQTLPPSALFRAAGAVTQNHNLARLPWTLALEDGSVLASGMDIVTLEGERITALYIFINPAAVESA
ncbi:hypothetical protein Terro_3668 [Terriglobus roseus DSM 18391]|uniref:SnoaL-like domain-containing protein n=1 Tax=Terriglobus roseus (strain DSM 18391 / NRRL B-41598 / KBS 63) TaxID=926566 RepID=I3ZKW2_TERRK|nr:nuclear transport factor 2 family protein [Terriglobus roseus]AFL89880.1 hypothetical protein Terro_3668 [Terriglobus roseus DSM 18391]